MRLDWLKRGCGSIQYRFITKRVGTHKLKDGTFIEKYHVGGVDTKDNNCYVFLYQFKPTSEGTNGWYAYILKMPDFNGRESNTHITHRFLDKNGTYYICWNGHVRTIEEMRSIAHRFAEIILKYIETGECQF